ncbi:hypothetical protein [Quadrisphaera sp. INWT6]|uniref:hypothetical protein n=1 Tax=Quadrisphaera sp. INWT6 TaxID=2596917 RepID=UPI0018923D0D|nr:hypothetical protein [Quadrisphaera sp. INWT6]MBF5080282.1 hypothetical protein [Quadrisphaera sp. INWT6]
MTPPRAPSAAPPPDDAALDADGPLGLRREPLTAALVTWLGIQVLLAGFGLSRLAEPLLGAAAAATAVALCLAVVAPLGRGRVALGAGPATAAVLAVGAVAVLNAVAVGSEPTDATSLFFPGLVAPVIGVLALRGRALHGVVAGVVVGVVIATTTLADGGGRWWMPQSFVSGAPLLLWWTGGVLVRLLLRTTRLDLRRSDGAFALARDRRERTREREAARDRRRDLLQSAAVPLLERVARAQGPLDAQVRARLTAVEVELRAELRGRDLMDADVRRAAAQARARGVRVDVVDHAPPGADLRAVSRLRGLVAAALDASTDGEITARRPPHEVVMTVVHVGSAASMAAVAAAVRERSATLRGLVVELSEDEDAVVVDVVR